MVEYMDDSDEHGESGRMLVASETAAPACTNVSVEAPRYYFDEQCEVVKPAQLGHRQLHPQLYSSIASWESFSRPRWHLQLPAARVHPSRARRGDLNPVGFTTAT